LGPSDDDNIPDGKHKKREDGAGEQSKNMHGGQRLPERPSGERERE
jgi:hypothetical protein